MATIERRGSEKLLGAWNARALTEDSVREIAEQFDKSAGVVERAMVTGGSEPTGLRMQVAYSGDDVPICGNDILFWLKWHRINGGVVRPPRIIIDGMPWPELLRMVIDFGHVDDERHLGGLDEVGFQGVGELGFGG